jgi:UMF1 family MFS transporter
VAFISPFLGSIADFSGAKKRFLLFFTSQAVLCTALLFFVQQGDIFIGMLFFILAEIGYRSAQVFYNALLPEIAAPDEIGRISGNGWAIGSFGGIICLLIVLVPIMLVQGTLVVRLSLVFTGLFFAVSALPIFLWVRERAQPQPLPEGENYMTVAFKRLATTFRDIRRFREFVKFIVAFLVYNDGILMTLDFAAILGAILFGLTQQQLIIFMIIVQVTSVVGAYLFGLVANDFGGKRALLISLLLMIVPVVWLYWTNSLLQFYFIGALAGFALTGVQSVSRSMVSTFSPPGKSAEFYGFFAVAGRTSSFIGPTIFGMVAYRITQQFLNRGYAELAAKQAGHRAALFTVVLFLVVGTALLLWVNEKKGRAAAEEG